MFWQNFFVIIICLLCTFTDLRSGKIYNSVTYSGALIGVALSFFAGWPGVTQTLTGSLTGSLAGLLGAFVLYAILYKFRGVAAGDVKLMAAVGAFKGFPFVIHSSLYIVCFASLLGLVVLAWKGRLIPALRWIGGSMVSFVIPRYQRPALTDGATTMPFAPAIFLGTAVSIWLEAINGPFTL